MLSYAVDDGASSTSRLVFVIGSTGISEGVCLGSTRSAGGAAAANGSATGGSVITDPVSVTTSDAASGYDVKCSSEMSDICHVLSELPVDLCIEVGGEGGGSMLACSFSASLAGDGFLAGLAGGVPLIDPLLYSLRALLITVSCMVVLELLRICTSKCGGLSSVDGAQDGTQGGSQGGSLGGENESTSSTAHGEGSKWEVEERATDDSSPSIQSSYISESSLLSCSWVSCTSFVPRASVRHTSFHVSDNKFPLVFACVVFLSRMSRSVGTSPSECTSETTSTGGAGTGTLTVVGAGGGGELTRSVLDVALRMEMSHIMSEIRQVLGGVGS